MKIGLKIGLGYFEVVNVEVAGSRQNTPLFFMRYMKKKMISLTNRWKVAEMVGVEVEYQLFTWSLGFEKMYTRRLRRALYQLENQLTDEPLGTFPTLYRWETKKKDDVACSTVDNLVTCGRCRNQPSEQNRFKPQGVIVTQKQTRSADEGMSNFYTCLDCGNKWRG